eukprot:CAMPEP_0204236962 /NCGR_PEP_ID=MMETSP0361-20130328/92884_1 /ASSEMBLY_ACC=CAM_ASM_000343 /TAXON_ID=268821 /ORGANISM="Scrippsiella Hangoei, Strain SHTV-5" /LENGTH=91 /DNA_ID=CAMNT_0051209245 /DNA_START=80 /DNA_END=355 /DNA_ORIENTATION=-
MIRCGRVRASAKGPLLQTTEVPPPSCLDITKAHIDIMALSGDPKVNKNLMIDGVGEPLDVAFTPMAFGPVLARFDPKQPEKRFDIASGQPL